MGSPNTIVRIADEALVRSHAQDLAALGAQYGVRELRYASVGRLLGRLDPDRDALDAASFAAAADDLLGAEVLLFSDEVLTHENVSTDLTDARPL